MARTMTLQIDGKGRTALILALSRAIESETAAVNQLLSEANHNHQIAYSIRQRQALLDEYECLRQKLGRPIRILST